MDYIDLTKEAATGLGYKESIVYGTSCQSKYSAQNNVLIFIKELKLFYFLLLLVYLRGKG